MYIYIYISVQCFANSEAAINLIHLFQGPSIVGIFNFCVKMWANMQRINQKKLSQLNVSKGCDSK